MQRYFLHIAYDGTDYCGWQRQASSPTVQQAIEDVVSKIFDRKVNVLGCGRTDSGVHASEYYAHFDAPIERNNLEKALRFTFPKNIALKRLISVAENSHARFDATERSYRYHIHAMPDPFLWRYSYERDFRTWNHDLIQEACEIFTTYDNYEQLCKNNPDIKVHNSKVFVADWKKINDNQITFDVSSNRYLHNQIRRMVGCLIDIGRERFSLDDLEKAMRDNHPLPYISTAAPEGLFLCDIKYPYL